jgi:hypothetical protein
MGSVSEGTSMKLAMVSSALSCQAPAMLGWKRRKSRYARTASTTLIPTIQFSRRNAAPNPRRLSPAGRWGRTPCARGPAA